MALGAITRPGTWADFNAGNKRIRTRDIVLGTGANYTTGGESITPAMVGLRSRITLVRGGGVAAATSGGATCRTVAYNYSTNTLQVFTTGSAEAGSNSDQSAFSVRLEFEGF